MGSKILMVVLVIILVLALVGCSGVFNLNDWICPDDLEFIVLIEELDTPKKICNYMIKNFTYEPRILSPLTPYQLYLHKKGDCDDLSYFAVFFANFHNYETWQIKIYCKNTFFRHFIAIYKENGKYNFSDNQYYFFIGAKNFREIVTYDCHIRNKIWTKYIVYDYDMNIVEQVKGLFRRRNIYSLRNKNIIIK